MVIETEQRADSRDEISFIIDAHEDIAWNWLELGRDPAVSALVSREEEKGTTIPAAVGNRTTGLPEWLAGRVGIIFATLFVPPARHAQGKLGLHSYTTSDQAHALAGRQLDHYRELVEREPRISLISTQQGLDQVVASWTEREAEPIVGFVVLMEGADPIREPAEVEQWYARGVRLVGLSWASTRYAGGTGEPGPLTSAGRQLLEEMANLNMVLDLSHMAERAYLQTIDSYPGPMIASHSNPRKFLPTDRGLSDEMIYLLAERDGVVGIVPFNNFLKPGWQRKSEVSIELVAQAIDHVAQLTGSSAHVGLGTDLDGGLGMESIPAEMDTVADLTLIGELLRGRGYAPADVERIMNGNWLRILKKSLP
jgi:membrane dipeptidase